MADVSDPNTDTKQEHLRRDVKITVEALPLGGDSKLQPEKYNKTRLCH